MDCRRNSEDELKGIWQSWDEAKKTRFQEKYGDVAQLLFVKLQDALLKAMVCFGDPTYRCFTFNEVDIVLTIKEYSTLLLYDFRDPLRRYWKLNVDFWRPLANLMGVPVDTVKVRLKDKNGHCISWSDIRDAIGKASGDRHLALFAFAVYRLIVFPKALGYVSVELANFLFQIEKGVNPAPTVLVETIISLYFIRRKGDKCFLGCAQLLFVWMKSHFRCLYKRFRQVFVPSTKPIDEFLETKWPPNQSIEEWFQNLSTLTYQEIEWRAPWMIRSTGGSFGSGPEILEEIGRDTNQLGSKLEIAIKNLFQPFPLRNIYPVALKKKQNLCVNAI
ncbi:hypothetical protein E1A91_D13G107300v1 [Gossypium mustelinum]|uniref:DUF7745 domain-containing protein n=1 Tax=Gossypium mustelinum TaxID=34275 RepID=A0A5D2S258_GOSMU|nr:hypothetical protein E1A91_D13G107300v1 [Gossypium mustelinum]